MYHVCTLTIKLKVVVKQDFFVCYQLRTVSDSVPSDCPAALAWLFLPTWTYSRWTGK